MQFNSVCDASPLIYFAKLDRLTLLPATLGAVAVPPAVINEAVDAGLRRHRLDARRIQQAIEDRLLIPLELTPSEIGEARQLHQIAPLGPGECEVIACASHRQITALLHDKKARKIATEEYKIATISPTGVLFLALLRRQMTLQDFKTTLHRLAMLTGISAATILEQEAIADEIARQLKIEKE